jgi:cysteinyl-tRNA synthetase
VSDRVPEDVRRLAGQRQAAREAKDFGTADALRERIRDLGFVVTDTAAGPVLEPAGKETAVAPRPPERPRPDQIASLLDRAPAADASVHWIVEGWPQDVRRGIASFRRHAGDLRVQHVVVDVTEDGGEWPEADEVMLLRPGTGWADARNAGLVRSAGRIVMVADGSVEARGDALGPLIGALDDAGVGVTGPYGIVTEEMHHFHESKGPEVDAIEGYLMAFRRELLEGGLRFDRKFRFYRTADIELSFQVKAMGLRALVTPVPLDRHEHRMWANTPEDRRDQLSKRNFYRFLDRWRGRSDLTVAGP